MTTAHSFSIGRYMFGDNMLCAQLTHSVLVGIVYTKLNRTIVVCRRKRVSFVDRCGATSHSDRQKKPFGE